MLGRVGAGFFLVNVGQESFSETSKIRVHLHWMVGISSRKGWHDRRSCSLAHVCACAYALITLRTSSNAGRCTCQNSYDTKIRVPLRWMVGINLRREYHDRRLQSLACVRVCICINYITYFIKGWTTHTHQNSYDTNIRVPLRWRVQNTVALGKDGTIDAYVH